MISYVFQFTKNIEAICCYFEVSSGEPLVLVYSLTSYSESTRGPNQGRLPSSIIQLFYFLSLCKQDIQHLSKINDGYIFSIFQTPLLRNGSCIRPWRHLWWMKCSATDSQFVNKTSSIGQRGF